MLRPAFGVPPNGQAAALQPLHRCEKLYSSTNPSIRNSEDTPSGRSGEESCGLCRLYRRCDPNRGAEISAFRLKKLIACRSTQSADRYCFEARDLAQERSLALRTTFAEVRALIKSLQSLVQECDHRGFCLKTVAVRPDRDSSAVEPGESRGFEQRQLRS